MVTDANGVTVGETRYYPYSETRLTTGSIFTDQLFTGQREMADLGIYNYGARFYSPKLGRFLSADSMVPNLFNPQDLNRFSYGRNNPLRYTDPTGHAVANEDGGGVACTVTHTCTQPCTTCGGGGGGGGTGGGTGSGGIGSGGDTGGGSQPLLAPSQSNPNDTLQWCDILGTDCVLSAASLVATVVAAVPGPIGWVGFGVDVVATVWAIGRTNDDYRQGEISKTRQYALNITGIVGVLPGGLLGEWAFPVSFVAGLANLLMTATGLPN